MISNILCYLPGRSEGSIAIEIRAPNLLQKITRRQVNFPIVPAFYNLARNAIMCIFQHASYGVFFHIKNNEEIGKESVRASLPSRFHYVRGEYGFGT